MHPGVSAMIIAVVLVNPATQEYQIDWERSSLVNGLVPAQFTLADDNKTYDLSYAKVIPNDIR